MSVLDQKHDHKIQKEQVTGVALEEELELTCESAHIRDSEQGC